MGGSSIFDRALVRKQLPGVPNRALTAGRGFLPVSYAMRHASEGGNRLFLNKLREYVAHAPRLNHSSADSPYVGCCTDDGGLLHCYPRSDVQRCVDGTISL